MNPSVAIVTDKNSSAEYYANGLFVMSKRILVILNPVAGRTKVDNVKKTLSKHFDSPEWEMEMYETTGEEQVDRLIRTAAGEGVEWVIAAGGDGTVSAVADGLALTGIPMGILPTGSTNVLAQELGIPLNVEKACKVLVENPALRAIDALEVEGKYYILAVGTGVDALTIEKTNRKNKRRFGSLAYVWSIPKALLGMQPRRFTIIADGKAIQMEAALVLISNVGTLTRPLRWGPHIEPDDGQIDISVIRGKHLLDYFFAAWDVMPGLRRAPMHIRHLTARESVKVMVDHSMPVQGDGDLIGKTPLEAKIIPGAVKIFVPPKI